MPVPARNDAEVPITVGVDTHLDLHVAVTLDHLGRLDDLTVPTTEAGYAKLLRWAEALESLERVGIEGALGLSAPAWRATCGRRAWRSSRSDAPSAGTSTAPASPTR